MGAANACMELYYIVLAKLNANVTFPSPCGGKVQMDAKHIRTKVHKTSQIEPTSLNVGVTFPSACGGKVQTDAKHIRTKVDKNKLN